MHSVWSFIKMSHQVSGMYLISLYLQRVCDVILVEIKKTHPKPLIEIDLGEESHRPMSHSPGTQHEWVAMNTQNTAAMGLSHCDTLFTSTVAPSERWSELESVIFISTWRQIQTRRTLLNEKLDHPRQLGVLVDVQDVRMHLHHPPLLSVRHNKDAFMHWTSLFS